MSAAAEDPQPSVNSLLRRTARPAPVPDEGREGLVVLARRARARRPETVARLLEAEADPKAALRALQRSDPVMFEGFDADGAAGRDGGPPPPGEHPIGRALREAARGR